MLRVGTILNGRYEIIGAIGSGGMSYVYKAKDMTLKRLVAVKVLKEEYSRDAGIVAKFAREAEAAGGLSHPNVVSVYDVGQQYGVYYIVMELVEGFTLKKYIEKKGKLSQRDAVQVTMQVARGLGAAHEQGIIHRDVKPQNIMVSRDGKIKVTDFGIARINDAQTSGVNTMGSVHYISPEQARGGVCDERSDIYSLGITLYEMVTGQVPFEGNSTVEVALKHIKEPITPPSSYEPDLNPNLEKIILKCTQKKPDYRYRSMGALLDDLKRLQATPYEDFVIMPAVSEVGATKIMNKEEAEEIRLAVAGRKESTDAKAAAAMLAAEKAPAQPKAPVKRQPVKTQETQIRELLSEEDQAAEAKARKVEKTLNYVMLAIAMLILIVVIAIVFRACGMFLKPAETTTAAASSSETSAPAPSESAQEPASTQGETTTEATTPSSEVTVPDMVGKDYQVAQEILEGLGLTVKFEAQNTGEYPEYTVFQQSYPEGTVLQRGTEITLWVALPSESAVLIPNTVSGKTVAEATMILTQAGLKVSDRYSYSYSSVEKGLVCDTNPSMGKVVEIGTQLTIVISLGPEKGKIPTVLGLTEEDARAALKKAGFDESRIITDSVTIYSETYNEGTVARIYTFDGDLDAGSSLSFSTDIYLTLSQGASFSIDPEIFLGRTDIDAVVNELMSVGLKVLTIAEPASTYPNGQICWLSLTEDEGDVTAAHAFVKGDTVWVHYSTRTDPTQPTQPSTEEPTTEAPTQPTEPTTEEETTQEAPQTLTIPRADVYCTGAVDADTVVAEIEALGFTVQRRDEPTSDKPYGQVCWLTTEEWSGTIDSNTELLYGSTVWVHISTHVEQTEEQTEEQQGENP